MKKSLFQYLVLVSLVAVLTWSLIAQAPAASSAPATPQVKVAVTPAVAAMTEERHPEIRKAMRSLEGARDALQKADHDFGGHRAKALEHVNAAMHECEEALKFDR